MHLGVEKETNDKHVASSQVFSFSGSLKIKIRVKLPKILSFLF